MFSLKNLAPKGLMHMWNATTVAVSRLWLHFENDFMLKMWKKGDQIIMWAYLIFCGAAFR